MAPHWYEFEEIVGRRWDRWASRAASYPSYPAEAVALHAVNGVLESYFRAVGGPAGLNVVSEAARASSHRLTLRQRLGMERETLALARRDDESLLLPVRIDCFPAQALNRDLYFWLTAFLAHARPMPADADPLRRDVAHVREAAQVSTALCAEFPGLGARYVRLCRALLEVRPERRLPPAEAALEAAVRRLLGADIVLDDAARLLNDVITSEKSMPEGLRAPAGYRPLLPVPLWGSVQPRPVGRERSDSAPPSPGAASDAADGQRRRAEQRDLDQADRDDPFMMSPFEKILSWTEMVNVNRAVDDDEPETAARAADQLETLTLSKNRKQASTRLALELDLPAGALAEGRIEAAFTYPEWHYRKQRLMPDYCAVQAAVADESDEGWLIDERMARRVRAVRRQFEALRPRRELVRGRPDGDELDTDALIRSRCGHRGGRYWLGRRFHGLAHASARSRGGNTRGRVVVDRSLGG